MNQSPAKLFPLEPMAILGFCVVLVAACLYTFKIGAAFVWPEALAFADLARGWAGLPHLGIGNGILPAYAGLLSIAVFNPNVEAGHHILIGVQVLLIASTYFPLRALLVASGLGIWEAALLAAVATLAPVFLAYAPLISPESLFIVALVYFAYFYDRLLNGQGYNRSYIGTGVTLVILMLTLPAGWVVFLASLIVYAVYNCGAKYRAAYAIWLVALFIYAAVAISLKHSFVPLLFGDNPLARFNFIKNGLVYVIYAGAPLAGLSLILAAFLKRSEFWRQPFVVFALAVIVGTVVLDGFMVSVYVDKKLDYVSNRMIDPFLFLPLIALFRFSAETRKEFLINGLLVFLVFAFFALPYGLNLDFRSGLAYWSQSLQNQNYGIIRNVIYLMLICIPAAFIAFRPSWVVPGYALAAVMLFSFSLNDAMKWWGTNEDSNLGYIDARKLPAQVDVIKTPLLTDYTCNPEDNNDVGFLYRCIDSAKALYFLAAAHGTAADITAEKPGLFLAAESDNRGGNVVAQAGLAKLIQPVPGKSMTPQVRIERMNKVNSYVTFIIANKQERLTFLHPGTEFKLISSAKGCVQFTLKAGMDRTENEVVFQLNDEVKKTVKLPLMRTGMPSPTPVKLVLPAGASKLSLSYESSEEEKGGPSIAHIVMFDRPWFEACK